MALYLEDIVDVDLNNPVVRSFAARVIGEGDTRSNRFGVRIFRDGSPVNINGGTCMGYFIRHGHADTVIIDGGSFSGNEAYVTLPESCYVYDGPFTLVIKLIGGGVTGTVRIVDGTVIDSLLGQAIDPGHVIPDIDTLSSLVARAEAAAATISGISITTELISGENYRTIITKQE